MQSELRDAHGKKTAHIPDHTPRGASSNSESFTQVMLITRNWRNGETVSAGSPHPVAEMLSVHVTAWGPAAMKTQVPHLAELAGTGQVPLEEHGYGAQAESLTRPK